MGLGLSITEGMVEAHGGRIWAENVGRRGVAFTFTIPSPPEPGRDAERHAPTSHSPDANPYPGGRRRTRGPQARSVAASSSWAIRSRPRPTRSKGLPERTAGGPDVVLLDLAMQRMGGLAALAAIRAWSTMPIIVLSVMGEEADKVRALDAGADDYLTKPFGIQEARMRAFGWRCAMPGQRAHPVDHAIWQRAAGYRQARRHARWCGSPPDTHRV